VSVVPGSDEAPLRGFAGVELRCLVLTAYSRMLFLFHVGLVLLLEAGFVRFVNSGVAGRRAGVGAVAVVVAGVVIASVGVGDAFAMDSRSSRSSGHSRAGRNVSLMQYRAKIQMWAAARFQAKEDIERLWSSDETSPVRLGYTMVPGARDVEQAWRDFRKRPTEEQNYSYPVVIAYKPGEHKEAGFLIPAEHDRTGAELYLTDQGEALAFHDLRRRWNSPGWSFYVKHVNRPVQLDTWELIHKGG
jgi:hypothetical protein